jgi:hypothetical protein
MMLMTLFLALELNRSYAREGAPTDLLRHSSEWLNKHGCRKDFGHLSK